MAAHSTQRKCRGGNHMVAGHLYLPSGSTRNLLVALGPADAKALGPAYNHAVGPAAKKCGGKCGRLLCWNARSGPGHLARLLRSLLLQKCKHSNVGGYIWQPEPTSSSVAPTNSSN